MKVVILGAGIAGCSAYNYFRKEKPILLEARKKEDSKSHQAVMRLRDPKLGFLLGSELEQVKVSKAIYYKKNIYKESNLAFNNMYSLKVVNSLQNRSIFSTETSDRFILKGDFCPDSVQYSSRVCSFDRKELSIDNMTSSKEKISYDICISTIPLPDILRIIGKDDYSDLEPYWHSKSICIAKIKLNCSCSIEQTIYYPDPEMTAYRASIEDGFLIIEFFADSAGENVKEFEEILLSFGISEKILDMDSIIIYKQKYGKIKELPSDIRKALLLSLTREFDIYSLGRFATWRNITADHLLKDLEKINQLIKLPKLAAAYTAELF